MGPHDMVGSADFVSPSTGDFQLASGSPAIDSATPLVYTSDILGDLVPFGNGPDLGAYEWDG
jgi:hypothetical protein